MLKRLALAVCLLGALACGGSSPTTPTAPSTQTAQIAGVWRGTFTQTSAVGGECLATTFASTNGASAPVSIAFTQTGASVGAIATLTNSGENYTFTGSVGQSALTMNGASCSSCNLSGLRCGTASRDLRLQTAGVSATVSGATMTGTETQSYNLFVGGTTGSVGIVTLSHSFTLTRQ